MKLDYAAHIVQFALTPVFFLTGIAALINVFTTRASIVSGQEKPTQHHVVMARMRSYTLFFAVGFSVIAGILTCGSAAMLFYGALADRNVTVEVFSMFGGALVLTICGLTAFFIEIILAAKTLIEN